MNHYARLKVFSSVYGVAYMGLFLYSELYKVALFRYYPVLGRFTERPSRSKRLAHPSSGTAGCSAPP